MASRRGLPSVRLVVDGEPLDLGPGEASVSYSRETGRVEADLPAHYFRNGTVTPAEYFLYQVRSGLKDWLRAALESSATSDAHLLVGAAATALGSTTVFPEDRGSLLARALFRDPGPGAQLVMAEASVALRDLERAHRDEVEALRYRLVTELVAAVRRCHLHDECRREDEEVGWLMAEECWLERRRKA